jgi:hypothetical protein
MGLQLDHIIDCQGPTPGGHFLDTQGYIGYNDSTVVLSYRCTTSAFDWIQEDLELVYWGMFSGFRD